ncbi:hypothetical protein OX284_012790 [Flavobacterium sp. SUN046]|uniref:hypothetical protein n=1 Tax=Flavobacterium sp. SUN046 TaxID=3002440 RepID=UPI002DBF1151|nr:hypothetical protein [Flavobacterium sp. SUN046]MEC4050312.1 hypothetical protein [Flavobacterium sp. SUN046]
MLVKVSKEIFENTMNHEGLDDLLVFFKFGRHHLVLSDPEDFLAFENSSWKKSLKGDTLKLIQRGLKFTKKKKKEITISEIVSESNFSLKEAYFFLDNKLFILIENIEYDTPFYIKIIETYDFSGELINAFQNGWLDFYHGGGSSIESVIRKNLKRSLTTCHYFNKSLEVYLRFFVLKDSDREYCEILPDGNIKQKELHYSKTKLFQKYNIPFHYLYKREKENYIPDSVFEKFKHVKNKKAFSEAYLKLNNHQKDFFDIEKGFSIYNVNKKQKEVKEFSELLPEVKKLYKKISKKDYEILGLGFVSNYSNFKANFSNEFKNVDKIELESRIKHQPLIKSNIDNIERNEFEHIINEIKYLL